MTTAQDLRTLFGRGAVGGLPDGPLLERFVAHRDEAAFEALVRRHGPMVLAVCGRVLRNPHDAEDAFQATFLVLARKAAAVVPRENVGNWLYGVAYQTAVKARAVAARRGAREKPAESAPEPAAPERESHDDLRPLLDRELSRLPAKYRQPIILCDLEGKTRKEAALQLGWPEGSVSGRLARARVMLARRLKRRDASLLGACPVGRWALRGPVTAATPDPLVTATARLAAAFAAPRAATAAAVPVGVAALCGEVLRVIRIGKLKGVVSVALAAALIGGASLRLLPLPQLKDRTPGGAPQEPAARAVRPAAAGAGAGADDAPGHGADVVDDDLGFTLRGAVVQAVDLDRGTLTVAIGTRPGQGDRPQPGADARGVTPALPRKPTNLIDLPVEAGAAKPSGVPPGRPGRGRLGLADVRPGSRVRLRIVAEVDRLLVTEITTD